MKTDSASALQLLDKLLAKEVKFLLEKEAKLLLAHQEICVRKLLPILAFEITQIKEGEGFNVARLCASIKLLAAFKEERAFDWIVQLHEFSEVFEDEDLCFVLFFWSDILVSTFSSDWDKLKESIEDPEVDIEIKEACIDALLNLVGKGRLDRAVVVKFFQSLLTQALKGELQDPDVLESVVEASLYLWPGELMEEIREVFGLGLMQGSMTQLSEFLAALEEGKEKSLTHLKNNWKAREGLLEFYEEEASSDEELEEELDEEKLEELMREYDLEDGMEPFEEEEDEIFPSIPSPEIENLPQKEQKKYRSLPKLFVDDPKRALETVSEMIHHYPHIPALFYYQYKGVIALHANILSRGVLDEWLKRFPNDLFAKIECARYLIRRGELDKVGEVFSNTWSLSALYPERTSFHAIERLEFFRLAGFYFSQMEKREKAVKG